MLKPFRAEILSGKEAAKSVAVVSARNDLDALSRARLILGEDTSFVLWQDKRRVFTYRPYAQPGPRTAGANLT